MLKYLLTSTGRRGRLPNILVINYMFYPLAILIVSVRSAIIICSQDYIFKIQLVIKIIQGLNYYMTQIVLKIVLTWHLEKISKINPRRLKIALIVFKNVFKNVATSVVLYLKALVIIVIIALIVFSQSSRRMI